MKIILTEDVKAQGKKGDVITVSDGYARSLIKKNQAIEATAKALNDLKLQNKHEDKLAAERLAEAQALGEKIKELTVEVKLKTGEGGRVFGSISSKEVSEAIKKQLDLDIDKKKLHIEDGIKSLGVHEVTVKLHPQVTSMIRVKVTEQ